MESQEANFNPANSGSISGILSEILKNFGYTLENSIPAVVKSYNRNTNVAVVQPAINNITTGNEVLPYDTMSLPVFNYGAGDIVINFPLKEGNTGWIVACDKDSSLFLQSLKVSNPNTFIRHKFSFGFFIPDKVHGASISQADDGLLVIQTLDGKTKICLGENYINVVSEENIDVTTKDTLTINADHIIVNASSDLTITTPNTTITSDIDITGDITEAGDISINGDVTQTGDVNITGALSATDKISSATDVEAGGISGKTHVHAFQGFSGDTSAPK